MRVVIMEMNGDKVSRTLSYIPSGRNWYNVVIKGEKQQRFSTPEETLTYLKSRDSGADFTAYVKIPQPFVSYNVESLRIA